MNQPDHTSIGSRLADAVPPLPEPADRVGEVRTRVRRARLRAGATTTGAAALLVAAALAVPSLVLGGSGSERGDPAEPPPLTGEDCPMPDAGLPTVSPDAPPAPAGATEAMLCAVDLETHTVDGYQVLETRVDRLVTAINDLEPVDRPGPVVCVESDGLHRLVLLLKYPDGSGTTVVHDNWCGISFIPDGPVWSGDALREFGRLYQQQVAANAPRPDTIATPECPTTIDAERLDRGSETWGPRPETIQRPLHWPSRQPTLPYELVAAAWCRYELDGDRAELAADRSERGDLSELRGILNQTFQLTDTGEEPRSECGTEPDQRAAVPDLVVIADATGGTAEYWVYGNPTGDGGTCWDALRDPFLVAAPPELVDYLLARLGP